MKRLIWTGFISGCAVLLFAFGIGWADWWELTHQIGVMQILMGAIGLMVALLVLMGILSNGKERWTALLFAAILALGFSGLVFFSIGWLIAPVVLVLIGYSLWKLLRRQADRGV